MVMEPRPKKLLDQLREVIRLKHYAYRTEETALQNRGMIYKNLERSFGVRAMVLYLHSATP